MMFFSNFNKNPNLVVMKMASKENWGIRTKYLYKSLVINYFSIYINPDEDNEDVA